MSTETETDGERTKPTPEMHYQWGMEALSQAHAGGMGTPMEFLLEALAHALLGGLRDGVDYAEKQKARELAESQKPGYGTPEASEVGALIEEDDDRP